MSKRENTITVFEHEIMRFNLSDKKEKATYEALVAYHGNGVPYFNLVYNGIKFCEYVGVIQVGKTIIEVLPKADKNPKSEAAQNKWRNNLLEMLQTVGVFDVKSSSQSSLKLKANTVLDLYFELFLKEVEFLFHNGLIKKYRPIENNTTALKGSLIFSKHIQQNLTHQERFYVRHSHYDTNHLLHEILFKTLNLLKRINTNFALHSRIEALLLNFPEMADLRVTAATFDKITFDRKTQSYQKATEIAKLLLLRYHPDINQGNNDVLALMFDMNLLWEQFVYVSLRQKYRNEHIQSQISKLFWQSDSGTSVRMRPDIIIHPDSENCIVIDTKWKNLNNGKPSPEDLRQMYVYQEYFNAKKVVLVYPSNEKDDICGFYKKDASTQKECRIMFISVESDIKECQTLIQNKVLELISVAN